MALRSAMLAVTVAAAAAVVAGADNSNSCKSNSLKVDYPAPVAADGWSYRLVANGFTKPRSIAFDKNGGLLVVDAGVGLARLALKDDGGTCLSVSDKKMLVKSEDLNHGLALSDDGKIVYASSSDSVFAWSYDSKAGTVGDSNHTVVANMSNTDDTTRTLLMSRKQPGTLVVSRGSVEDIDQDARQLDSGHSQIRSFDVSGLSDGDDPRDFLDGHVLGWGLRNSVGVAEDPATGGVWSVENSVDELYRNGKDVHQDNPGEELNFHGRLQNPSVDKVKDQGGNYGYPLCFAVWSTKNFPDIGSLKTGDQFPNSNSSSKTTDKDCNSKYQPPRLAFQAHTAPLDIKFTDDGSQAVISFHGSFDRKDPVGYHISTVSFKDGQPSASQDSTDAAKNVLSNPDMANCPDRCFRPVGLAWDAKDRLWFSSDSTGEIFVLQHDGSDDDEGAGVQLAAQRSAGLAAGFAVVLTGYLLL